MYDFEVTIGEAIGFLEIAPTIRFPRNPPERDDKSSQRRVVMDGRTRPARNNYPLPAVTRIAGAPLRIATVVGTAALSRPPSACLSHWCWLQPITELRHFACQSLHHS